MHPLSVVLFFPHYTGKKCYFSFRAKHIWSWHISIANPHGFGCISPRRKMNSHTVTLLSVTRATIPTVSSMMTKVSRHTRLLQVTHNACPPPVFIFCTFDAIFLERTVEKTLIIFIFIFNHRLSYACLMPVWNGNTFNTRRRRIKRKK
jgi:hypothetical protein